MCEVGHVGNGADDVTAEEIDEEEGHCYPSVDLELVDNVAPPEIGVLPDKSDVLSCFEE